MLEPVAPIGARVRPGCGPTGPQHLADPALADAERRQGGREVVGQARPRGHVQLVVAEDPDRDVVDAESPFRLVHDRAEQFLSIVRRGQPLGDAEDAVEPLGELRFEADPGRPDSSSASGWVSGTVSRRRKTDGRPWPGARSRARFSIDAVTEARSHTAASSHRGCPNWPSPAVPGGWS